MKLYNQLTKKVETFKPQNPENVKIYTCGPTVYNFAHIGNLTSYIYWDLLVRTLTVSGYKVNRILNLTDVGHLASDADDGEDKLEKGAKREGKTVWEVAERYIDAFLKDFRSLNLIEPTKICRATDYIAEDIILVDRLRDQGYTYETTDGIYFDTSKFPTYADFARLDLENLKAGARVALSSEKRNPSDFAIWKFIRDGEDHAMRWDYLGRPGYPGWHLECVAISHTELGFPLDIHTGGIDHLPIHHTNEIAEAEAAFDIQMSRFWTHCNFITIDGEKISKSIGNTYTLSDLVTRGFSPLDFKLWVLQGHYQSERNFSFADLEAAKNRRLKWRNRIAKIHNFTDSAEPGKASSSAKTPVADRPLGRGRPEGSTGVLDACPQNYDFRDAIVSILSDNLNSSGAFALIDSTTLSLADWQLVDALFGLDLVKTSPDVSAEIAPLLEARAAARASKDFATADKLRATLATQNVTILDTPDGQIWQYLS